MERILKETLPQGVFRKVPAFRSRMMRSVRSRGNRTTEGRLRAVLTRAGLRGWKIQPPDVLGNPDFFFTQQRVALFVDGCFWHCCRKCGHFPRTNARFWRTKLERNRRRDLATTQRLRSRGIQVIRIWEHELHAKRNRIVTKLLIRLHAGGA